MANLELDKRYPDVQLKLECPSDCHWEADPDLITLVLKSVLSNALDHGLKHDNDVLTICAKNESNKLMIQVQDQGHGIERENLEKIINPFFTTKRHAGHVGLGLHIAYIVTSQTLNGTLRIDSEPDQGTTVTMEFTKDAARH